MSHLSISTPWRLAGRQGRFDDFVAAMVALCLAAIWMIFAIVAYQTYQSQWRIAGLSANNIAALLENDIALNFKICDRALLAMRAQLTDPGLKTLPDGTRERMLLKQAADARATGVEMVLNADGHIVMDSHAHPIIGVSLADRSYFRVHRDGAFGDKLFVSEPFRKLMDPSQWQVALSRRFTDADGRFAGVVLLVITIDYFQSLFGKVQLPPGSVLDLVGADDRIIVRTPFDQANVGRQVTFAGRYQSEHVRAGDFRYRSRFDGVSRLYAFRKVADAPLTQIVGVPERWIYENWIPGVAIPGAVFLVLSGFLITLNVALRRELRRRTNAETALKIKAGTDALTGLANRRRFDETLEAEWRRSTRMKSPLSLILLDCDFFKSYNDYYGHLEGDQALVLVANAISASISRSGDLAARIGGEEFAVLLPATTQTGAAAVAEQIRCAVLQCGVPHALSPAGQLTISAGVTCKRPQPGEVPTATLKEADLALYAAKATGRNVIKAFAPGMAQIPANT